MASVTRLRPPSFDLNNASSARSIVSATCSPLPSATPIETVNGSSNADAISRDGEPDAFGDLSGFGCVGLGQQHAELLAAVAVDDIAGAHLAAQDIRNVAQSSVTCIVAVFVVDPLEVIDIDHDHGHRGVAVARLDSQITIEPTAVADTRQIVTQCQLGEVPGATAADGRKDPDARTHRGENADGNQGKQGRSIRAGRCQSARQNGGAELHQRCIGAGGPEVEP